MSEIYLGADGAYHDDTEANRELFPAAEDTAPEDQTEGVPGETAPDSGTLIETGTDTGSEAAPVVSEPAPEQPAAPAKAPKDSTK